MSPTPSTPQSLCDRNALINRRQVLGMAGASVALAATGAQAQAYPTRPLRFVVPYAAGGGTDLVIRALQEPLSKALGQPIVVDNKSGAAGAIGAREVARAAADGHTFLVSNNGPSVILPLLQKEAGYDPVRDFTPVTTLAVAPIVLIANPSVPATDTASFIDWARQQKAGVTYASAGAGSIGHLAAEQFAKMAGVQFLHVPYRGQAPTINAVMAGETQAAFTSSSDTMINLVRTGRIRLIGVGTEQPTPLVPGGTPIARGLPGYKADFWQGVLAPAGTPMPIVQRVAQEIQRLLALPEMQQKYTSMSYGASTNSPAAFAQMVAAEVKLWSALIAERSIRLES
jgi:tripartite-type tricarboxylate transporter receptor subunit TctC